VLLETLERKRGEHVINIAMMVMIALKSSPRLAGTSRNSAMGRPSFTL
jgi:hypothetical protein